MSAFDRRSRAPRATGAFTLIEIVMVVALLAAIAGMVVSSMQGTHEQVSLDLARHELNEVRKAVLSFRADTGFLPKQGVFDLDTRGGKSKVPSEVPAGEAAEWFDHPANLWQLVECPLPSDPSQADFQPLSRWDPSRRRGWRGPYLTRHGEGVYRDPETAVNSWPVPAIADPFTHGALVAPYGWFSVTDGARLDHLSAHRPILLILDPLVDSRAPCLVSAGPDGDVGTSDDLVHEVR